MTEPRIYPINPTYETTTRDGRKAIIIAYNPSHRRPWAGFWWSNETMSWLADTWSADGSCGASFSEYRLTTVPDIPPEAREPKPGEIWERQIDGSPMLIAAIEDGCALGVTLSSLSSCSLSGASVPLGPGFRRPWPASAGRTRLHDIRDAIRGQGND